MARNPAKTHNVVDPKQKKLFLEMRDHWKSLDERANSAAAKRRQYQNEAKAAGFSVKMFKDSLMVATPEGEAEFKAEMANRLLAAAYSDADIGEQLSLFLDHNRTPAVDRAYKEGQTACMQDKPAQPKYDPGTDQYQAYMDGFHAEQERMVKAGIGKLDAKAGNGKGGKAGKAGKKDRPARSGKGGKAAARAAKPAGKRGRPAKPKDDARPRKPTAAPVTRASLAADKAKATDAPESYFSKSTEPAGNA